MILVALVAFSALFDIDIKVSARSRLACLIHHA